MTKEPQQPEGKAEEKGVSAATLAKSAALGAARGGLQGAAVGAAKAALSNRRTRRRVIGTVTTLALLPALLVGGGIVGVASINAAHGAKRAQLTSDAEAASSIDQADVVGALRRTSGTVIPQTIFLAIQRVTGDEPDVPKLHQALVSSGITADSNDPAAGSVPRADGTIAMGESNADKAVAEQTQSRFVAALTSYGLAQDVATQVFTTARQWALGAANTCASGAAAVDGGSNGPSGGSSSSGGAQALTDEQSENARIIIGVARSAFGDDARQAAVVGLATALQESGLRNIRYGDRDSLGLFQQRANWGSAEQRLTPSYAAGKFYAALRKVPGWQQLPVTVAAQKVQISAFPDAYAKWESTASAAVSALWESAPPVAAPAESGLGASDGAAEAGRPADEAADTTCTTASGGTVGEVSGDVKSAAAALLPAIESGSLTFLDRGPKGPAAQIRDAAAGTSPANCTVHLGALQTIQIAVSTFGSVQVSSLNRACSGAIGNSNFGTSPHSANGGGRAVDYSGFGGRATTGADANAIKYLNAVAPFAPEGNVLGFGQANCRAGAGTSVSLPGIRQFKDFCNHVHVDFGNTGDGQLKGR
ncbi:hypothetical protein [Curtobacterium sp. 20TX0008]|uniref:hypothetical protein n=1 Tax=Curtobacterium sp. 20TX0008 TaxID=3022018 RepID=UPI00232B6ED8|nr:hypothetical protein [Curtobacterium sp. 20TX0008]MDB6425926.1 hypothetical protein [Curtobacterium sp. 20TX0008]